MASPTQCQDYHSFMLARDKLSVTVVRINYLTFPYNTFTTLHYPTLPTLPYIIYETIATSLVGRGVPILLVFWDGFRGGGGSNY
jgi:hypothetical protein